MESSAWRVSAGFIILMRLRPQFVLIALILGALVLLTQVVLRSDTVSERAFHVEPRHGEPATDSVTIHWESAEPQMGRVDYGPTDKLGYSVVEEQSARQHAVKVDGLKPGADYYYRVESGGRASATRRFRTAAAGAGFHVEPYLQLPTPTSMTIMWETTVPLPGEVEYGPTPELGHRAADPRPPVKLHQVKLEGLKPGERCYYRVQSGEVMSKVNSFRTAPPLGTGKWRMALYGDSRSNPFVHRKVVEQIAKANVDLILHTGDIVLSGKNYDLWRLEFFAPLAPIAGNVPWVSTIGNHEQDAENYFSYMALPGNERYFGFDFANAHIVCLDSNGWIEKGRDSKQFRWMEAHLKAPREALWTFAVFHHPLFSAHRDRGINPLRWDWAPLFLDPACRMDGVLSGHDHFYARCHLMTRGGDEAGRGVMFMTSAGGGAALYPIKKRDYLASIRSVHHFTLFAFDGDQVTITPIDTAGRAFDRFVLRKGPSPAEERCAYEVEELKEFLRRALAVARPIEIEGSAPAEIDTALEVPTRFSVPVSGRLRWKPEKGWEMKEAERAFTLSPREPLRIPLEARVQSGALNRSPALTIEFDSVQFCNRTIDLRPFKISGPGVIRVPGQSGLKVDGSIDEPGWQGVSSHPLFGRREQPSEPGEVRLASDGKRLLVAARLVSTAGDLRVSAETGSKSPSKLVLSGEHLRIEVHDGKQTHIWALSPEQIPYYSVDGKDGVSAWQAAAGNTKAGWVAECAIPLYHFADLTGLRANVVHRSKDPSKGLLTRTTYTEFELRPTFGLGTHPDLIPDWKSVSSPDRFATIRFDPPVSSTPGQ